MNTSAMRGSSPFANLRASVTRSLRSCARALTGTVLLRDEHLPVGHQPAVLPGARLVERG